MDTRQIIWVCLCVGVQWVEIGYKLTENVFTLFIWTHCKISFPSYLQGKTIITLYSVSSNLFSFCLMRSISLYWLKCTRKRRCYMRVGSHLLMFTRSSADVCNRKHITVKRINLCAFRNFCAVWKQENWGLFSSS